MRAGWWQSLNRETLEMPRSSQTSAQGQCARVVRQIGRGERFPLRRAVKSVVFAQLGRGNPSSELANFGRFDRKRPLLEYRPKLSHFGIVSCEAARNGRGHHCGAVPTPPIRDRERHAVAGLTTVLSRGVGSPAGGRIALIARVRH